MSEGHASPLADAMAGAAANINSPNSVDDRVRAAVDAARTTLPGFAEVSISLSTDNGPVGTGAASSELVETLDLLQYDTQQGPCLDAFTRSEVVLAPSLRHDQRWPRYVPAAVQAGVMSQLAVPLRNEGVVRGALNLYSTTREGIDPRAVEIAALFATHVALALGWARTQEQLVDALESRKLIGQALGIVMERYQIDQDKAFAFLVRVSSTSNIKLRDAATEVVAQTEARFTRNARAGAPTRRA